MAKDYDGKHRADEPKSFAAGGRGERKSADPNAWTNGGDRSEDASLAARVPLQRDRIGSNDPGLRAQR